MLAKGFGGAERLFVDLCAELGQRGHTVQAACHVRSEARRWLADCKGVELAPLPVRGSWDLWSAWHLARAAQQFRPDLIHAHLGRAARLSAWARRRTGAPLVVTMHNYQDLKYYRDVQAFVAITDHQRRHLMDQGISAARIERIPNFSRRAARSAPALHGGTGGPLAVLAYGRMVPKKGFHILLEAFRKALDGGLQARLVLAGEGPERPRLEALAATLELQDRVAFPGWIEDVGPLLEAADLFVLPSLEEPFGIVLLEAMAAGLPMVATRTPGPLELLDPESGWLVPAGDPAALAGALLEAAGDPGGRRRCGERGLTLYRERYSADAVLPRYEAFYRRIGAGGA